MFDIIITVHFHLPILNRTNLFYSNVLCVIFVSGSKSCYQPKVVGPCRAGFRRWWYNRRTKQCEKFMYGGCGGNGNNFRTKRQCERCKRVSSCKTFIYIYPVANDEVNHSSPGRGFIIRFVKHTGLPLWKNMAYAKLLQWITLYPLSRINNLCLKVTLFLNE